MAELQGTTDHFADQVKNVWKKMQFFKSRSVEFMTGIFNLNSQANAV